MIFRFVVIVPGTYRDRFNVECRVEPADQLALVGGIADSFLCTVTRSGSVIGYGVSIPIMDMDRVRVMPAFMVDENVLRTRALVL